MGYHSGQVNMAMVLEETQKFITVGRKPPKMVNDVDDFYRDIGMIQDWCNAIPNPKQH